MKVSELVRSIRVLLDENQQSTPLINVSATGSDQLDIDALIKEHIPGGLQYVILNAPVDMLGEGEPYDSSFDSYTGGAIKTYSATGTRYFEQPIGSDVLRVISGKMSNWAFGVSVSDITTGHPLYRMQFSRFAGIRATNTNPLVVKTGRVATKVTSGVTIGGGESAENTPSLAASTSVGGLGTIGIIGESSEPSAIQLFPAELTSKVDYIRVIKNIEPSSLIDSYDVTSHIDTRLSGALKYAVASFVCTSLQDERAGNFMVIANEMMGTNQQR